MIFSHLAPFPHFPQISPSSECVACVSVAALCVQGPGVGVAPGVRQSLAQMVLTPHQPLGHSPITRLVTMSPASKVPSWTWLLVTNILTLRLGLDITVILIHPLAIHVETFHLPGLSSSSTSSRARAPWSLPPREGMLVLFHLFHLNLHDRSWTRLQLNTFLLRPWLLLVTTNVSADNFISSFVVTFNIPPSYSRATRAAA